MNKPPRRSQAELIAAGLGWDIGDVREAIYQPTRFRSPNVYAVGNVNYAAHATKPKHDVGKWEAAPEGQQWLAKQVGKTVWRTLDGGK